MIFNCYVKGYSIFYLFKKGFNNVDEFGWIFDFGEDLEEEFVQFSDDVFFEIFQNIGRNVVFFIGN